MRAWTVDADDIQIADDLDVTLLHRTSWIENFLEQKRSDQFIITATKGFGKTLLLKAKRISYGHGAAICIPDNSLLDKPIGDKVFNEDMIALYGESTDNWKRVWLISIVVAVLKRLGMIDGVKVNPQLHGLIVNRNLTGVVDHFVNLLDFERGALFRSASETDSQLIPRIRNISSPVAIFIDSIDEYFNKHITTQFTTRASHTGELSPNVWYFSQMGLVEVAYQLRRVSHQLKVFVAIRKEVFAKLDETTSMAQQYRGSTVDIVYSPASLREIFISNIRRETPRNLVDPGRLKNDPIIAFFGTDVVTHDHTGEREDVFEYVCRHTLRRPRDFMTVGRKLSELSPEERRREHALKNAVHNAATAIAREYINEIHPYLGGIDLYALFRLLEHNVLTRAECEAIFLEYAIAMGTPNEPPHVFSALFRTGLLGWVNVDPATGQMVQRFLLPGERPFEHGDSLPESSHYLVHPVLTALIGEVNPRYVLERNRANEIGSGRPWIEQADDELLCAVRADILHFSGFLSDAARESQVRQALRQALEERRPSCVLVTDEGDAFTLVHRDPREVLSIVKGIQVELYETTGEAELRVAVDYGPIGLERDADGAAVGIRRGHDVLRNVARIEPLVSPSQVWVTERFKDALERTPSFYRTEPIEADIRPELRSSDGTFNVKKPGSLEEDHFLRLFRIVEPRR
jgi:LmbE family N-acetylglucosaminyl deacetylase